MTNRVYNFCAGPCTLPLEALQEAQAELTNFDDTGMSIIEQSHRSKTYDDVHFGAVQDARDLLNVPDDFALIFMQGGATLQFAMIAMNLLGDSDKAAYVNSGHWAKAAIADAEPYGEAYEAWSGKDQNYTTMPLSADQLTIKPQTRYLHITANETIGGVRLPNWIDAGVPLIGDMSSDYLSREIQWDLFDLAYGGAQKNMGPSGLAMVVIRKSILEQISRHLPSYLDYRNLVSSDALFNTPPVFAIYVTGKVLKWVKANGGVSQMKSNSEKRAALLYDAIDRSGGYYSCPIKGEVRSRMNVVFRLSSEELEDKFVDEAEAEGMANLKGHRSVGGIRASIYNAMDIAGVEKLVDFMQSFQDSNS